MKELEEGDNCPSCGGILEFSTVDNCSCHINPPCEACTNSYLRCLVCEWDETIEEN